MGAPAKNTEEFRLRLYATCSCTARQVFWIASMHRDKPCMRPKSTYKIPNFRQCLLLNKDQRRLGRIRKRNALRNGLVEQGQRSERVQMWQERVGRSPKTLRRLGKAQKWSGRREEMVWQKPKTFGRAEKDQKQSGRGPKGVENWQRLWQTLERSWRALGGPCVARTKP